MHIGVECMSTKIYCVRAQAVYKPVIHTQGDRRAATHYCS
jgi:hypothetical protein